MKYKEFRQELWCKALAENMDRTYEEMQRYFEENYEKVKHYKFKLVMNRIFRTRFRLYKRKEVKPVGKIKIRKFGE